MSEKRKEIETKVDQLLSGHKDAGVRRQRKTRRSMKIMGAVVAVLIAGALIVGAVLLGLIGGVQEQEVTITGKSANVLFDGQALHNDLIIASDLTDMVNGEYKEFTHTLENLESETYYQIDFTIDDSWFATPESEEFGLTYGVLNSLDEPIDNIILDPLATETVTFWFSTDSEMMSGLATTVITIEGDVVTVTLYPDIFGGDFGFKASGRTGGGKPIFQSYSVDVSDVTIYEWTDTPTDEFEGDPWSNGWSCTNGEGSGSILRDIKDDSVACVYLLGSKVHAEPTDVDIVIHSQMGFSYASPPCDVYNGFLWNIQEQDQDFFEAWVDDQSSSAGIVVYVDGIPLHEVIETGLTLPEGASGECFPVTITQTLTSVTLEVDGTLLATLALS